MKIKYFSFLILTSILLGFSFSSHGKSKKNKLTKKVQRKVSSQNCLKAVETHLNFSAKATSKDDDKAESYLQAVNLCSGNCNCDLSYISKIIQQAPVIELIEPTIYETLYENIYSKRKRQINDWGKRNPKSKVIQKFIKEMKFYDNADSV